MASLNLSVPGRTLAGITAIVSLPFAYLTQYLFIMASDGNVAIFHDGAQMMGLSAEKAYLFYLAMWTDVLGYYLIFIPLIIFAWKALRHVNESLTDIAFLCGLIYCVMGAMAAVTMAGAHEAMHTSMPNDPATAAAWEATIGGQWDGVWLLEGGLAVVWLGGLTYLLGAIGLRLLAIGAAINALLWFGHVVAAHLGMSEMSGAFLGLVALVSPLWAAWLGIVLLRAAPRGAVQAA